MNARAALSFPSPTAEAVHRMIGWAAVGLCFVLGGAALPSLAADTPAAVSQRADKPAAKPATKAKAGAAKKAAPPADAPPAAATDEQRSAAERVYYGEYECDFKQTVQIDPSQQHPAYVDLRFAKASYLMKPVLSSTGAIRLEDVKGQTLMVQISSKSMLLNVKTGTRLVDACVSARQREEIEAAAKHTAALEAAHATDKPTP